MDQITSFVNTVPPSIQLAFAAVGVLYVGSKILGVLRFFLNTFILSGLNLRKYGKKGTWAVVTGASDGIGKEFATQLAAKGFNVVLISRTKSKLNALAKELEEKYGSLQTKTLAIDYEQNKDSDYERLAETISGLDVGILINNVGRSHSIPTPFLLTEKDELENIITINCLGTLKTTKVVAPILAKRGKALILTMGSFSGWIPIPYLATYSGSKAFLQHWSSALAQELKSAGVDVQLVSSWMVTGAMSKVRRTNWLTPNPKSFVRAALSKIGNGTSNIAYTYTPWWSHALVQYVVERTIGEGSAIAIWYNLITHQDIRKRALRKAERLAKKA